MVVILWALLIGVWAVDIAIVNRDKKICNVESTIELWTRKVRAKDFILDLLNIVLGCGLIYLGKPKISVSFAEVVVIVAIISLLADVYRATKY